MTSEGIHIYDGHVYTDEYLDLHDSIRLQVLSNNSWNPYFIGLGHIFVILDVCKGNGDN